MKLPYLRFMLSNIRKKKAQSNKIDAILSLSTKTYESLKFSYEEQGKEIPFSCDDITLILTELINMDRKRMLLDLEFRAVAQLLYYCENIDIVLVKRLISEYRRQSWQYI